MPKSLQVTSPAFGMPSGKRGRSVEIAAPTSTSAEQSGCNGSNPSSAQLKNNVKMPAYLDKSQANILQEFQELEWKQRFRLFDALQNPETSPYRMDKSSIVMSRNRYANVQPWDTSRIKLKQPMGGSDYVNASPVVLRTIGSGGSSVQETRYIATHGPKTGQFAHFWHMVHQQVEGDTGVVVMLTQLYEQNREKCAQYFPADFEEPTIRLPREDDNSNCVDEAGHMDDVDTVTLVAFEHDSSLGCDVRVLRLNIDNQPKTILHYLYLRWPDFGKPEAADRKALVELSRRTMQAAQQSPRIVHCSAGVGRTGTWIALDHLVREVEAGRLLDYTGPERSANVDHSQTHSVHADTDTSHGRPVPPEIPTLGQSGVLDGNTPTREEHEHDKHDLIFDTVNALREQRVMMVVNEVQLQFLYEAIREAVLEKYKHTAQGARISHGTLDESIDARRPKIRRVVTGETDGDVSEAETEIMIDTTGPRSDETDDSSPHGHAGKTAAGDPYSAVSDEVVKKGMKEL